MNQKKLIIGVDEAGKSPLIGPMFVVGVSCEESKIPELEKFGIRDSKMIPPLQRPKYYDFLFNILDTIAITLVTPREIDYAVLRKDPNHANLNWLLIDKMAKIIERCIKTGHEEIRVDAISQYYDKYVKFLSNKFPNHEIKMDIQLDEKDYVVAAASIIASDSRYRYIQELKREIPILTGECCDSKAVTYAKSNPGSQHVRWSWKTVKDIYSPDFDILFIREQNQKDNNQ